jgi:hypothetical protein
MVRADLSSSTQAIASVQERLFPGIDLARELDRMAAIQRAASKLSGEAFATAA